MLSLDLDDYVEQFITCSPAFLYIFITFSFLTQILTASRDRLVLLELLRAQSGLFDPC